MKSRLIVNLLLFVLALGLSLYAYLRARPPATPEFRLSTLSPSAVSAIRIERGAAPPIVLKKQEGVWRIVAPLKARADQFKVQRLLEILSAQAPRRFPARELARYGLNPPAARLTLEDQSFDLGSLNPVSDEQYVATEGRVYLIAPRYGAALPVGVADVLSREILSPWEVPTGFRLPGFQVTEARGTWQVKPASKDLSPDDVNRWVEDWRLARAEAAEPDRGLGASLGTVRIALKGGKTVSLEIRQKEPQLVLARQDEGILYRFPEAVGKRLLAPPSAEN